MTGRLYSKNFRRGVYAIYAVGLLDLLAVSLFLPLLNRQARDLGASPFLIGVIGSVYGAVQLFSSPVAGWCSDVYGRKLVLTVTIAASAFAYSLQGTAASLTMFVIARSLAGFFKHTQTIGKAMVADLAPNEKSYVIGNFNAFGSMGFILGPTIGSHLIEYDDGFKNVCYLATGIFLLKIVLIFATVPQCCELNPKPYKSLESNQTKTKKHSWGSTGNDMSKFTILAILSLRFLFSFSTLAARANLTLILESKFDVSIVSQGYLYSLQALVSTVTGFAVGPISSMIYKENHRSMVIHSGIIKLLSLVGLFIAPTFRLAGLALLVQSGVDPFLRVGVTTLSLDNNEDPGTILGLGQTATSLSRMLAPAAAGIAQTFSDDGPAFLGGLSSFLGLLSATFLIRSRRPVYVKQKLN